MRLSLVLSASLCFAAALTLSGPRSKPLAAAMPGAPGDVQAALSRIRGPVAFVPNLGQWEHPARYVAHLPGSDLFLERDGLLLSRVEARGRGAKSEPIGLTRPASEADEPARAAAVRLRLHGARRCELVPERLLPGHYDFFLGDDPARWRTEVPLYGAVRYRGAWPGVDLLCHDRQGRLEYDLELAPGADLGAVQIAVEGAGGLRIDGEGPLVIDTALGPIVQDRPRTWELDPGGGRHELTTRYELRGPDRFGFAVSGWSGEQALVIDPGLTWSTFSGGKQDDWAYGVSVDAAGMVTIAGGTRSPGYPTTTGAWDPTFNGNSDVFVTTFDPRVSALVYSTFIGGDGGDVALALAVDGAGIVTITGFASGRYPTTANAWDPSWNGGQDAFVTRLDPSQPGPQQLLYSTFLGGELDDSAWDLQVDATGVVTLAGWTQWSPVAPQLRPFVLFPTTANAWDTTFNGGAFDAFVARLDPALPAAQQLVYSTFLGGAGWDGARSLSVDAAGVVTVAGGTNPVSFPTTANAFDTTPNGNNDAFLARLDPSLPPAQQLLYSTLIGGAESDGISDLSVDEVGVLTAVGGTASASFPTTPNAWDTTYNGNPGDAFVIRLDLALPPAQQLLYSTYLGGRFWDGATALRVDPAGVVTLTGLTTSDDFPTTAGAWDQSANGTTDVIVTRLDPFRPPALQVLYSTYVGGVAEERGMAIDLDPLGAATVAGCSQSPNYPTLPQVPQRGAADAIVTQLDMLPTGARLFGDASPGCNGPLSIGVTSMPRIGNQAFTITGANVPRTAPGWLLVGSAALPQPLPVLGARLWIDPAGSLFLALPVTSNARTAADLPLPIPNTPSLVGARFHAQYAFVGPNAPAPCPPLGISASAALEITILP